MKRINGFVNTITLMIILVFSLLCWQASAVDCVDYCIRAYETGWSGKDPKVTQCSGDPKTMLVRGGSQNWPMNCEMGKALYSGNWGWFEDYAKYSKELKRFHSTEFMSPIYHSNNLAAVLHWYIKTNNQDAKSILRANWAWIALNMETMRPGKIWSHSNRAVWEMKREKGNFFNPGWVHYSAATRSALPEPERGGVWHPGSLVNPIMHFALDLEGRSLRWGLCASPGWYFPLKSIVRMMGIQIRGEKCTANLMEKRPSAEIFGITAAERQMLRDHIQSYGKKHFKEVLGMIDPDWRPACTMTVLRTTEGITSWFGSSDEKGHSCNSNKPPQFAISYNRTTHTGRYLKPYTHCGVGCPRGWTERRGNKIFALGHYEDSIGIVAGDPIYEITWHHEDGLKLVYPEPEPECKHPDPCYCEQNPTAPACQTNPTPKPGDSIWKQLDKIWVQYRWYIIGSAVIGLIVIILMAVRRKD